MLKRNLQAWYNSLVRLNSTQDYVLNIRDNGIELKDNQIKQIDIAGFLDLLSLTYKNENITILDDIKGLSPGINRGKSCIIKRTHVFYVYISPVLEGYVVSRQARYQHRIYLIYDFSQLDNLGLPKLGSDKFKLRSTPMLDLVLEKIYHLPYILSRKGINTQFERLFDNIVINLDTGEILIDITELEDGSVSPEDVKKQEGIVWNWIYNQSPEYTKSFNLTHPEVPLTVLTYDLPEIDLSISHNRVWKLLRQTNHVDSTMALISLVD